MLRAKYNHAYPVQRPDEARTLHRHREDRAGARDPARRPSGLREHGLPGQLSLRVAAERHPQLAHADAPDRHPVPQGQGSFAFIFGGEADNHAINTVPKETLVRVTKAEDGGLDGRGAWQPGQTGMAPGAEDDRMRRYLAGEFLT